eukprot:844294-Rhodomonas_salina.1
MCIRDSLPHCACICPQPLDDACPLRFVLHCAHYTPVWLVLLSLAGTRCGPRSRSSIRESAVVRALRLWRGCR